MTEKNFTNILSHYKPGFNQITKESFGLVYGAIVLPYLEQEKTYARFEGPMGLVLRVETEETHNVEEAGVIDRLAASLAINLAPGVDVAKIRTDKRTIALLSGQEIVTRLGDLNGKELFLAWGNQGKKILDITLKSRLGLSAPMGTWM